MSEASLVWPRREWGSWSQKGGQSTIARRSSMGDTRLNCKLPSLTTEAFIDSPRRQRHARAICMPRDDTLSLCLESRELSIK